MHDDMQLADKAMTQIHAAVEGLYDTLKNLSGREILLCSNVSCKRKSMIFK